MALLNKRQYKQLLSTGVAQQRTATDKQCDRVLQYATKQFPKLELKPRGFTQKDVCAIYQLGQRSLFHVRAFPRKQPDTVLIVVADEKDKLTDHILIDLAAESAVQQLNTSQFGLFESTTKQNIRRVISGMDLEEFAILGTANGGTYIQTYREPKGFLLEYQLVNTSSHYRVRKLVTSNQVIDAMISYAFAKDEWLEAFAWQRMKLN
jgi:hypothetical protein